ncbi:MAG: phospholipid carrier-dependent glycosyltransferase, partial [Chloroflexi bacterium]
HIYPYFQHLSIQLFGASLGGLRMASTIFGTLTVMALYMLGRVVFNRRVGLLAALLLAVFPPHIHFSRLALNNIADPLFGVLALWLVVRALQRGKAADWLLAGIMLGLTQYFYEGGRLLFPVLVALWLLLYVRQLPLRAWLYWALGFILIAFPIYYVLWLWRAAPVTRLVLEGVGNDFWARFLAADAGFPQLALYFRERFMPSLLHIFHTPDGSAFYYGGDTPLLWLPLVPFFFMGVAIAVRNGKRGLLLLMWLLLTVLGNSLIVENDWSARFVVLFPALALLMALGLDGLFHLWRMAAIPARFLRHVWLAGVALLAVGQIGYYFGAHLTRYNQQIRPFRDHQDVGFRSALLPANTDVYLLTNELTFQPHIDTHFRLVGVEGVRVVILPPWAYPYESIHRLPLNNTSFFFAPDDAETLWRLRRAYGTCLDGPFFSPYNVPLEKQYVQYDVLLVCLQNAP